MHDSDRNALHLSDSEIGDDPMGGVGATYGYMVALLQTKIGQEFCHTADLLVHLTVGIMVAAGGVLGSAVLGEIEIRESRLVPVGADSFRENGEVVVSHQ